MSDAHICLGMYVLKVCLKFILLLRIPLRAVQAFDCVLWRGKTELREDNSEMNMVGWNLYTLQDYSVLRLLLGESATEM
jgi:hypothetical protein